jgi:ABC-type multidrug transport system fused ATPase/permease subunit
VVKNYWRQFEKFRSFIGSKSWLYLKLLVALGIVWFLIDLSFVFIIQIFLHSLGLIEQKQTFVPEWLLASPVFGILSLLFFGIGRAFVAALKFYFNGALPQAFVRHQREKIFKLGISKTSMKMSADIINLFSDRTSTSSSVVAGIGNLVISLVAFLPFIILGLSLAPLEFLCGGFLFSILILPVGFINKRINSIGLQINKGSADLYRTLVLALKNRYLIWIYNVYKNEVLRVNADLDRYNFIHQKYFMFAAIKNAYTLFVSILVVVVISYLGITYMNTPGMKLIGLFYIFLRLGGLATDANSAFNEIKAYWPAFLENYKSSVDSNADELIQRDELPELKNINKINASGLYFTYPGREPLIKNLNFEIKKGDLLLIKGESGVGKSTIISLLLGLLKPDQGLFVLNNNLDSKSVNTSKTLGYVGPEPFIFPGTVRENLIYGHSNAKVSDSEIWDVLKHAQLDEIIKELSGLDTFLNEDTQLSTGQKQRLSIARALLRNPSLLILDEATANLDTITEKKIKDVIIGLKPQIITIVISHKESFDDIATHVHFIKQ